MKMKSKIIPIALSTLIIANSTLAQPSQQKLEPPPTAPKVSTAEAQITQQAGVGSDQAYARAGVLELGGSGNLVAADKYTQFSLAPSVGWFFANNWQISGILSWGFIKQAGADVTHRVSLLAEPSFHVPFDNTSFCFVGFGVGISGQTGNDLGFAIAPRIGYKTLIGRSGMVTVDLRNTYSTSQIVDTSSGTALTVKSAFALGVGYTVLW